MKTTFRQGTRSIIIYRLRQGYVPVQISLLMPLEASF